MLARLGGWWRLWVVVCVTYGVIVAVFTWTLYPSAKDISYEYDKNLILEGLSDRTLEIIISSDIPPPPDIPEEARTILEMPNGHALKVPENTTPEQAQAITEDYDRVLNSITNHRRLSTVTNAFLAWVIPCLVILALGAAMHWVYQGFRQNRT